MSRREYLHNERYKTLTMTDDEDGVTWNGHTWPRSYTCEVEADLRHVLTTGQAAPQVRLTCGHWTSPISRFCPHCGRAIVVRV